MYETIQFEKAASFYKEALSVFRNLTGLCEMTTDFELDLMTGIVRCYKNMVSIV